MSNAIQETQRLGQSIWYDNIERGLITSGEWKRLVDMGVSGLTSNPTIFEKAIAGSADYDDDLARLARDGKGVKETFEALAIEDLRMAVDELRPVYDRTDGVDGYGSLEVSPALAHDTEATIAEARRLFQALDRPNAMIKVPATPAGIPAVRQLIGDGLNINVTLIFSLEMYRQVAEAYILGLEDLLRRGGDVTKVASVASFFVSRVDKAVDDLLNGLAKDGQPDVEELQGKAAIANAQMAYGMFKQVFEGQRFKDLKEKGARMQRPLWASTGTKNPDYDELLYIEQLMAPYTVNTVPPKTLMTLLERGRPAVRLDGDTTGAQATLAAIAEAGVDIDSVTDKLLADGVKSFADSFDSLLSNIAEKRERLSSKGGGRSLASLGASRESVEQALETLQRDRVMERIWRKDHTVWKPEPTEIANRLGWLDLPETMVGHVAELEAFADEVKGAGYEHVVLLGMGGSSLGPEVLRQTFGSREGYPRLIVLDSTVPSAVAAVAEAIDPAKTLFLVASKSGSTIEVLSFYKYFRSLVEEAVGTDKAGERFVAITDPGTSLGALAGEQGFRRVFANPEDIGGRYSVLSYFGLVPAALIGLDVTALLHRAEDLRGECSEGASAYVNSGACLGAAMGTLAKAGRDKLTIITSPGIAGFGLWAEQLIAESTGKEGVGIVPVAGEPLMAPEAYGRDRFFVYLRLKDDDNGVPDGAVDALQAAGQPVLRIDLRDRYDVGAEFYRWEMATAVAGHLLGVNPFDQPNVQQAKDATARILDVYKKTGSLPDRPTALSTDEVLSKIQPGDYLTIQAYTLQSPGIDDALTKLRRQVAERLHIATTMGYGPRYLHSTGQLHKGGPPKGVFLQFEEAHQKDVAIPGEAYGFSVLARAQAMGDLEALAALGRPVGRVEAGELK